MKKESKKHNINNKLGKISNKIYLQNKYIRNNKEKIIKLIMNKRKNKKRNNSHSNIPKKHQEHSKKILHRIIWREILKKFGLNICGKF